MHPPTGACPDRAVDGEIRELERPRLDCDQLLGLEVEVLLLELERLWGDGPRRGVVRHA